VCFSKEDIFMVMKKSESGFNLVELMVVVAIIGILSAVAVPRFATFKAKAIQTEAKQGLNGLYLSMAAYESNTGARIDQTTAGAVPVVLGFALPSNAKYGYTLHTDAAGTFGWAAKALSTGNVAGTNRDAQRINGNKLTCIMFDGATGQAGIACPQTVATTALAASTAVAYTGTGTVNDAPL
jgi:prepilin-type N-terminal cleavage/methylation domain-containing protein